MIYLTIIQAHHTGEILLMDGATHYTGAREIAEGGLVDGHMVSIVEIDPHSGDVLSVEEL